jgi:hypothetical protein
VGGPGNNALDGGPGGDTFVGNGGTDAIGGAGSSLGDTILVGGTAGSDTVSLSLDASGFLLATVNGLTTTYTDLIGGAIATAGIERVQVDGLAGTDALTVDSTNGAVPIPVNFDAGADADRLILTGGTATSDTYAPGANPGQGTSTIVIGGVTQAVSFNALEPVIDLVAGPLVVNAGSGDNAINYRVGRDDTDTADDTTRGRVSIDGLETIDFSNKTTLTINGLAGSDTVNLNNPNTPTGLTGITVDGGDPTGSDTLVANGTAGTDAIVYAPTAADGGTLTGAGPVPVTVAAVEQLTVNGRGGGDTLTVVGTSVGGTFTVTPGAADDAGLVRVTGLLGVAFLGLGAGGGVTASGGGGLDTLVIEGTLLADTFDVAATTGAVTLNTRLPVGQVGIPMMTLAGLGGGDTFLLNLPLPYSSVSVVGGGADILALLGALGTAETFTVNPRFAAGSGNVTAGVSVDYSGVGSVLLEANAADGDALVVNDDLSGNVWSVAAGPTFHDRIRIDARETIDYLGFATVALNNLAGTDQFIVRPTGLTGFGTSLTVNGGPTGRDVLELQGTAVADAVTVTATTATLNGVVVTFGTGLAALSVSALGGDDSLTVDSASGGVAIAVRYDGGDGTDSLALTGGTATSDTYRPGPAPGTGTSTIVIGGVTQAVSFANLEPVTDDVAGPPTVTGTPGDDTITYSAAPTAGFGQVAVNGLEPILFTNKTTLTIDGGTGGDTITLTNAATPTGLTGITADGNIGLDSLVVNAFGGQPDIATAGILTIPGQPGIGYANFERVQVLNAPDQPLTTTPASITGAVVGQPLTNVLVGSFADGFPSGVASDFTASINWGDGSPTTAGVVLANDGFGFQVFGSHTYTSRGLFGVTVIVQDRGSNGTALIGGVPVSVQDPGFTLVNIVSSAAVRAAPLSATGQPVTGVEGVPIPAGTVVATFTDAAGPTGTYAATVAFGGTAVAATVTPVPGSANTFQVTTTAAFTPDDEGVLPVAVTITNTASAPPEPTFVATTATIADAPITLTPGPNQTTPEGTPLVGITLATFTDAAAADGPSNFTATIDWGDGSPNSLGTITKSGTTYTVTASHTFATSRGSPYTVTVVVKDAGGSQDATTLTATVTAVVQPNQPPAVRVPGPQPAMEAVPLVFSAATGNAITVSDPDAGTGAVTVTLSVTNGTLTLGRTAGLTVTGNGQATVTATGTLADLNAGLDGLTYRTAATVNASDTLTVTANDNGNTGAGGSKTATGSVGINAAANPDRHLFIIGTDNGGGPVVRVFTSALTLRNDFFAYDPTFRGGVHVAVADMNGDGVQDFITGAGVGGAPLVVVFDGVDQTVLRIFYAYDPAFRGGVNVAAADVTGDGVPDLIAGAGVGGSPHVTVFDGVSGQLLRSFFAFDSSFRDGVNVGAGDINGDGRAEVIAGAALGGGPQVGAFDGMTGRVLTVFFAFDPASRGGVNVATGDMDGDGRAEIIAGPGSGLPSDVKVFDATGRMVRTFRSYEPEYLAGVTVGAEDLNGDGADDFLVATAGGGVSRLRALDGRTLAELHNFTPLDPGYQGGVFVG